jgi:hypothetical protein
MRQNKHTYINKQTKTKCLIFLKLPEQKRKRQTKENKNAPKAYWIA